MITYTQYHDSKGQISARDYYGQFVNESILSFVEASIGRKNILNSTDPHFNDIPLQKWDRLNEMIRHMVDKKLLSQTQDNYQLKPGQYVWSLSDVVCIAKTAAKIIKESN